MKDQFNEEYQKAKNAEDHAEIIRLKEAVQRLTQGTFSSTLPEGNISVGPQSPPNSIIRKAMEAIVPVSTTSTSHFNNLQNNFTTKDQGPSEEEKLKAKNAENQEEIYRLREHVQRLGNYLEGNIRIMQHAMGKESTGHYNNREWDTQEQGPGEKEYGEGDPIWQEGGGPRGRHGSGRHAGQLGEPAPRRGYVTGGDDDSTYNYADDLNTQHATSQLRAASPVGSQAVQGEYNAYGEDPGGNAISGMFFCIVT
jgi:hypothetical protein